MKVGRMEDMDRTFDIAFWRAQGPEARIAATWELVEIAAMVKGTDDSQLRLQRTVVSVHRV